MLSVHAFNPRVLAVNEYLAHAERQPLTHLQPHLSCHLKVAAILQRLAPAEVLACAVNLCVGVILHTSRG